MSKLQKQLYLRHDVYELEDEKMAMLDKKFSHVGYSIFWRLCTYMLRSDDCYINFKSLETISERSIFSKCKDVEDVVNYCIEIELFHKTDDETAFYNKRVKKQWEDMETAKQNGREGGLKSAAMRKSKETQAPLKPPSSPPQAKKKDKKKNKQEGEGDADAISGDSSDGSSDDDAQSKGLFSDLPPDTKELCNEICNKFKVQPFYGVYCKRIEDLIKAVTPQGGGREAAKLCILNALKKLDTAKAITSGTISFGIEQFLQPDKFTRLIEGDYDIVYKKSAYTGAGVSFDDDNPMYKRD